MANKLKNKIILLNYRVLIEKRKRLIVKVNSEAILMKTLNRCTILTVKMCIPSPKFSTYAAQSIGNPLILATNEKTDKTATAP